jgi:hypothetical protein
MLLTEWFDERMNTNMRKIMKNHDNKIYVNNNEKNWKKKHYLYTKILK